MRICFISPKAYPLFNPKIKVTFGGAEVQLYMLGIELAKKKDLDVNFITADYGQKKIEEYLGVKVWKSLNFESNKLSQILCFFKIFNKVNADIYVQRTLTIESGLIALYTKLRRKKFIYMVAHDSEADGMHNLYASKIKSLLARLTFKFADVIFVQNNYEKEWLSRRMPVEKIVLLKKGLDLSRVPPKRKGNKKYDAIWVGRSERWKNVEAFLNLAEEHIDKNFLLICMKATTDSGVFSYIRKRSKKISNLTFLSMVIQKEIYKYLSESRIFVLTSEKEGDWPMTVLEATATSLPVLSLSLNYGSLIDEYCGGIFCNNNEELLNASFIRLSDDMALYNKMSQNAYEYVKDNHDIVKNAKTFLSNIN
jgi:glycosyltransferase involved in cell wall biosynthesis